MIAYLIDPFSQTVTEVEIPHELAEDQPFTQLQAIYKLMDCETVQALYPTATKHDIILVDENGRISGKDQREFMTMFWPRGPLAGKAIWIGTHRAEWVEPKTPFQTVSNSIFWGTSNGTTHQALPEHV
jgi:hypothetical protein